MDNGPIRREIPEEGSLTLPENEEDFNIKHPELREGEVFITNSQTMGQEIDLPSKRVGEKAYGRGGELLPGEFSYRPIFALRDEVENSKYRWMLK